MSYKTFTEELDKAIIRKFNKRTVHSFFIDNLRGADLGDMQFLSKFKNKILFLLCVIDFFSKYAWVISLKDKNGTTITYAFQNILKEINQKSKKIWVVKGREFYNRSMKSFLQNNNIEICSTHNKGKSVLVETLIRTLKNKICKYMTSVSKFMYIDILYKIINTTRHIIE